MEMKQNLSREFLHACQSGELPRVKTLTSQYRLQDWSIFRHSTSGDTPLHVAAREGHESVVRFLCEAFEKPDFRVDVTNKDMKRPLHEAAQFARSRIVDYLLEKGACVDTLKRADWTPLMLACTKTGLDACKCIASLLEANANLTLRNKDGWTPMHLVCRSGDTNAFNTLIRHSPRCIEDRTNNGRSTMHIAAFHGHEAIIDLLARENRELLMARDSAGSSPLHEAIKSGKFSSSTKLINLGADVHAVDAVGQTILHIAALTGNTDAIKYILDNKFIDLHSGALFGVTPLIAAQRSNQAAAIDCLLSYGARK